MLATGATITAMALTLGQTALAQDDSSIDADSSSGNGHAYGQSMERPCLDNQLSFEQMQVKILEKLAQNETRLKEKLAKVDTLKVSDEVKAKMKERLKERLLEIGKTISQVKAAATKEDLQQIRKDNNHGKKMGWQKMEGKGKGKGLLRRLDK